MSISYQSMSILKTNKHFVMEVCMAPKKFNEQKKKKTLTSCIELELKMF